MAPLFDLLLMRALRTHVLTVSEVIVLRRQMREHQSAIAGEAAMPQVRRRIARSPRMSAVFGLWRLSLEQPAIFLLGTLLCVPGLCMFAFTLAGWAAKAWAWAAPALMKGA